MIRIKDRLKSLLYRLLRSDAANSFNACKCKKKRNWADLSFKNDSLIGYDKILAEWVIFTEYNFYAKVWVMNGYIVNVHTLDEKLWNIVKLLCRKCITTTLKNHKD